MKRVVITGYGTVNPIGNDVETYWQSLIAGKSGINTIQSFDVSKFTTQIAGEVIDLDTSQVLDPKSARRMSRFIILAVYAAKEAVEQSGLDFEKDGDLIGVEIGSGIGGIEILESASIALHEKGPSKVSPFTVPMMICDMASGQVAIQFGARGPNSCSVTACASSANSMANAFFQIRNGNALAMITGGSEACVTPLGLSSFCAARSLSKRNDAPQLASRPFDADRDGFVMGEGAGILVFEEFEHAKARGAKILGEVIGYGASGDAYHITAPAPEGEGAKRALKMALEMGQVNPSDIDYINAHGTSTLLNDKNETAAIKAVLGEHAYNVNVSSTKSMTGHLLGAAGAIEIIASVRAMNEGLVPPTINLDNPADDCDLNYTPNTAVEREMTYALSNSFGFGGHNAVLLVKKFND